MSGKKFQFRLEAVLKLRKLEAEQAKAHLAEALQAVVDCRQQIRESQAALEELLERALAGNAVHDLRRFAQARSSAIDLVETRKAKLAELEAQETAARHQLAARMRDQQALEDLRQRQKDAFVDARDKAEQMMLDELGVLGHGRKTAHLYS